MNEKKRKSAVFQAACRVVRRLWGRWEIVGLSRVPPNHTVIVANHAQMNGPVIGELFMPEHWHIWCAGEMLSRKEVPQYAFADFWSQKPRWTHPFYKVLSYVIAPLASYIFQRARTVPVYKDRRIINTFRRSVALLEEGNNLLIFPETGKTHNNIVYQFQENFVQVAKMYHKRTGVALTFVPMYIAPSLKQVHIGEGTTYNIDADAAEERPRIAGHLADQITAIAQNLPPHIVVPYRNIPKRKYLSNKDVTEVPQ